MTTAQTETVEGQYVIELDVTTEGESFRVEDLRDDLTKDLDLTAKIVDFSGPAGGWPVVHFSGTAEAVLVLLWRYYEGDIDSVAWTWREHVHRNF